MNPNPNRAFKRTGTRSLTEARETPVILVCIYNKNGTIITHDLLHQLFSSYGKILRILIFEKMQVWKSFVEYENVESAMQAKKNLDNFLLFNDGSRINIYFSNLEVIRFQNNNDGGIDYTLNDPKYSQQTQPTTETFSTQPVIDSRLISGGSLIQVDSNTSLNQSQPKINSGESSRYAQRERIPFTRTSQRAISNIYAYQSGLSQIDSGDEEPQEKNQMKMPRNYPVQFQQQQPQFQQQQPQFQQQQPQFQQQQPQFQQQQPQFQQQQQFQQQPQFQQQSQFQQLPTQQMGVFRPEEQKINQPNQEFHITKFFSAEPSDPFQPNSLPLKKPPGIFPTTQDSFFDIKPKEKPLVSQDPDILNDIMNKMQDDFGKYSLNDSYNGHGFPNGDNKMQQREFTNINEIPNPGFDQLLTKSSLNQPKQNNDQILNILYDQVERDFFEYQQQQQQIPIQNLKFNPPQNFQDISNPLFPELNKNFMNPSLDQLNNTSTYSDPLSISTESRGYRPSTLITPTSDQLSFQSKEPQFSGGQNLSQEGIFGLNVSQIPELQNFDPADLKNPMKLALLYEKLSLMLGIDNSDIDTKKSPVLYVRGLEHPDFKIHMLYNTFSNFGNIRSIIYTRIKGSALIEFENSDQSSLSKDYLNNVTFMGKMIKIYYSNYEALQLHNKKSTKGQGSDEVFIGTEKSFRFKKNKSISINPPSSSLHISNLVKEACTDTIIRQLFERFGRIEAMKFLFMDNTKNMCLLRMGSMEESINAMAFLHDFDLMGRRIQISFTRSKI